MIHYRDIQIKYRNLPYVPCEIYTILENLMSTIRPPDYPWEEAFLLAQEVLDEERT